MFYVKTVLILGTLAASARAAGLPNPFYAMDTAIQRPGLTQDQQFDLVKELGYPGVAWHEQSPAQVKAVVADLEKRGLKMFTIYSAAKVTPAGTLEHSPTLVELMGTLKGHGTTIWLHVGGKGPAINAMTGKEPLIGTLRSLADAAAANDLEIAVYPHLGEWTARFGDATHLAKLVNHPRFGVSFNLCHCLATGDEEKIPSLLKEARPVLLHVQINGADRGVSGGQWKRLIQPLGKGSFDVGGLLVQLKQIGYTGPIAFQAYGIPDDARTILAPTMEAWRKLSAAAAASSTDK
jgi:sugar phosphate isomerase/epimerase